MPGIPGQTFQNASVESVNGRFRGELPNETLFRSRPHARAMLAGWRTDHNTPSVRIRASDG